MSFFIQFNSPEGFIVRYKQLWNCSLNSFKKGGKSGDKRATYTRNANPKSLKPVF